MTIAFKYRFDKGVFDVKVEETPTLIAEDRGGSEDISHGVMVMEIKQIGNVVDDSEIGFKNPQRGRVYDSDGISPCLSTMQGGVLNLKC